MNGSGTVGGRPAWRCLLASALLLAWSGAHAGDGMATRHAVIIGVSDYALLPPRDADGAGPFDLESPRHDVPRMVRLARDLRVPESNLVVLANGDPADGQPDGPPTRARILEALRAVADASGPGHQVLVYFSGHGSQMPDLEGDEADGLDEILLPADIGRWNDDLQVVENAITDDDLGEAVRAIRANGADAWVVVDACHAGTALRGAPVVAREGVEMKAASPASLGVPRERLRQAQSSTAHGASRSHEPGALDDIAVAGGDIAAFYAATSEEAAIASPQRLPDGSLTPTTSLLTFALTEAVATGQAATYRDLALRVRGYYDAAGTQAPQPAFEGEFDRATFGDGRVGPRRWAVRRQGSGFVAEGGSLDGLHDGAILAVRDPRQPDAAPLAHLRVDGSAPASATLVAVAHDGTPVDAAARLAVGATYEGVQVAAGVPMRIRVARPPDDGSATARAVSAAIARIGADAQGAAGANLAFVDADAPADLYLRTGPDRVWFADVPDGFAASGRSQPPFLVTAGLDEGRLADALDERLAAFARHARLRAAVRAMEGNLPAGIGATVVVDTSMRRAETQPCPAPLRSPPPGTRSLDALLATGGGVATLHHCDVAYVELRNDSDSIVEVTPLYFDREFGISFLGSGELFDARIEPGASATYLVPISTYDARAQRPFALGLEEFVLVVVPRATGQEAPATYAYLARPGGAAPSRSTAAATSFDRLVDAAGFGGGASRAATAETGPAGTLRLSWIVGVP